MNCGIFLKRWEHQTPYLPPEKSMCRLKETRVRSEMKQRHGSKLGKEYVKAVYAYAEFIKQNC